MAVARGAPRRTGAPARAVAITSLVVAAALSPLAPSARAQGFRLSRYAAPSSAGDLLWLERAAPSLPSGRPFFRLVAEASDDPLDANHVAGTEPGARLLDGQVGFHLAAGLRLAEHLDVALLLPLFASSGDALALAGSAATTQHEGFGVGDPGIDLRAILLDDRAPLEIALAATLRAPLGNPGLFAGDGAPSFGARLLVSRGFGRHGSWAGASAGVSIRPERSYATLELGPELVFAAGALLAAAQGFGVTAEIAGSAVIARGLSTATTPLEGTLGARYEHSSGLVLGVGLGTALSSGYGAPDARATLMIAFAPRRASGSRAPGELGSDADGDGVRFGRDWCPERREDHDGVHDADGCPDLDDDHDGLDDEHDRCPLDPEDLDGARDGDGCPDPDDDGDGVADRRDRCPRAPEDDDGVRDDDGCPDLDDDRDGVADLRDACPRDPETLDGVTDHDGCPDTLRVEGARIRTLRPVRFREGSPQIHARSYPMLRELARLLLARPELGRVSVVGHTDSRGRSERNRQLSEQRARRVLELLVSEGVPRERLRSSGLGESQPLEPDDTPRGRRRNRRVELLLLDRSAPREADGAAARGP